MGDWLGWGPVDAPSWPRHRQQDDGREARGRGKPVADGPSHRCPRILFWVSYASLTASCLLMASLRISRSRCCLNCRSWISLKDADLAPPARSSHSLVNSSSRSYRGVAPGSAGTRSAFRDAPVRSSTSASVIRVYCSESTRPERPSYHVALRPILQAQVSPPRSSSSSHCRLARGVTRAGGDNRAQQKQGSGPEHETDPPPERQSDVRELIHGFQPFLEC